MASEIDETLEKIRERRLGRLEGNAVAVPLYIYDKDVTWLLNYVDMLRADLSRKGEGICT